MRLNFGTSPEHVVDIVRPHATRRRHVPRRARREPPPLSDPAASAGGGVLARGGAREQAPGSLPAHDARGDADRRRLGRDEDRGRRDGAGRRGARPAARAARRGRTTTGCLRRSPTWSRAWRPRPARRGASASACPARSTRGTGRAKGASSTWLNGRPVEEDLRAALGREVRTRQRRRLPRGLRGASTAPARGHHVVFAVILGSGAGAGIAVGGRAHHGPNNSAGEWGHNPLPFPDVTEIPGAACYCGRHGCLETWVSGRGVRARLPPPRRARPGRAGRPRRRRRSSPGCAPATGWPRWSGAATSIAWRAGCPSSSTCSTPTCSCMGGGMSNVDELYADLPRPAGDLHVLAGVPHAGRAGRARRLERRARRRAAVGGGRWLSSAGASTRRTR